MQKQVIREQIRKRVARSGNSGAVWVPKDWLGEEIVVTRLETPKLSLEEELVHLLVPYLKDISGIFVYGSYARKEETKDSDIDVLIIAKEKLKIGNLKKFDITSIELKKINEAIQKNPFIYAIIHEAKPLFNSPLLEDLKKIKGDFKPFILWFKETTEDSIKSTKGLIDLDAIESSDLTSYSTIYSLILRLRGIFLIKSVLRHRAFSNLSFKTFLTASISESEFQRAYKIYRIIRDNKKMEKIRLKIHTANKLMGLLRVEMKSLNAI